MSAAGWTLADPAWLLLLLALPAITWLRARRGRPVFVDPVRQPVVRSRRRAAFAPAAGIGHRRHRSARRRPGAAAARRREAPGAPERLRHRPRHRPLGQHAGGGLRARRPAHQPLAGDQADHRRLHRPPSERPHRHRRLRRPRLHAGTSHLRPRLAAPPGRPTQGRPHRGRHRDRRRALARRGAPRSVRPRRERPATGRFRHRAHRRREQCRRDRSAAGGRNRQARRAFPSTPSPPARTASSRCPCSTSRATNSATAT